MASLHSSADEVRIHFFVDDDIDKHDLSEAARYYFFHDIQSYRNESKAFLDRYRPFHTHAAYLEAEYDSFCFFRWIIFSREVKVWNSRRDRVPIERVLALDLDVLMTVSPARFFNNVFNAVSLTDGLRFVSIALGAVVALTTEGLADLSDYIFGFYFNQTDAKIRAVHTSYGIYFTDMMIMKEFAARAPSTRNICFDYATPMSNSSLVERPGYKTWRNAEHNQCLLRHLGCIPMSNYRGMRNGLRFYRFGRVLKEYDCVASPPPVLRNKDEELPFCYIHFPLSGQGAQGNYVHLRQSH